MRIISNRLKVFIAKGFLGQMQFPLYARNGALAKHDRQATLEVQPYGALFSYWYFTNLSQIRAPLWDYVYFHLMISHRNEHSRTIIAQRFHFRYISLQDTVVNLVIPARQSETGTFKLHWPWKMVNTLWSSYFYCPPMAAPSFACELSKDASPITPSRLPQAM